MTPKKHPNLKPSKSLAKEVDEGYKYFWKKRGMTPPNHSNVIMDNFSSKKPTKPKTEE